MNWDDLRFLDAFARQGSLARAAEVLGVDKSTVYRRLDSLSEALGQPVVRRTGRGYALTDAGRAVAEVSGQIRALVAPLEERLGVGTAPAVTVSAPMWFCRAALIPALPTLLAEEPGLLVDVVSTDRLLTLDGDVDISVRNVRPTGPTHRIRRAGELRLALYGARAYLERRGTPTHRDELHGHHFVAYENWIGGRTGFAWLDEAEHPIAFRATDALAQLDAARAGLGLCVLPCLLGDAEPSLVRLDDVAEPTTEVIWLVSPPATQRSARVGKVAKWLQELFRTRHAALMGEVGP